MCDVSRFLEIQDRGGWYPTYGQALAEIRAGCKRSHWIWYVFPQVRGLGLSEMAVSYGIRGLDEARAYLADPVLNARLREISAALLDLPGSDPARVMGSRIDGIKLCSSMTLFARAAEDGRVFREVLDKYFDGREDARTLAILGLE